NNLHKNKGLHPLIHSGPTHHRKCHPQHTQQCLPRHNETSPPPLTGLRARRGSPAYQPILCPGFHVCLSVPPAQCEVKGTAAIGQADSRQSIALPTRPTPPPLHADSHLSCLPSPPLISPGSTSTARMGLQWSSPNILM